VQKLEQNGLQVVKVIPMISGLLAHMWDVGMRPFLPHLIDMTRELDSKKRAVIKQQWMETCETLFLPFAKPMMTLGHQYFDKPVECLYVVQKAVK